MAIFLSFDLFPLTPPLTLQKVKHTRHQFAVLVDELQSGDSTSDYQATVMTTIKCIVSTPQDVRLRVKLRNQFFSKYIETDTVLGWWIPLFIWKETRTTSIHSSHLLKIQHWPSSCYRYCVRWLCVLLFIHPVLGLQSVITRLQTATSDRELIALLVNWEQQQMHDQDLMESVEGFNPEDPQVVFDHLMAKVHT